jgi:hypothetical protein
MYISGVEPPTGVTVFVETSANGKVTKMIEVASNVVVTKSIVRVAVRSKAVPT